MRRLWLRNTVIAGSFLASAVAFYILGSERNDFRPADKQAESYMICGGVLDWVSLPVDTPMPVPLKTPTPGSGYVLEWPDPEVPYFEAPDLSAEFTKTDDRFEVAAFATWHPKAEGAAPVDDSQSRRLLFRDPKTLEPLSDARLDELRVPLEFREFAPVGMTLPNLRLLIRSNLQYPDTQLYGSDSRTRETVLFNRHAFQDSRPGLTTQGEWVCADNVLGVWHDAPIDINAYLKCGQPQLAELSPTSGAEVVLGRQFRVQWLDESDKGFRILSKSALEEPRRFVVVVDPTTADAPASVSSGGSTLVRVSHSGMIDCCGAIDSTGAVHWLQPVQNSEGGVALAAFPLKAEAGAPLRLVFMPDQMYVSEALAGLPDLPNPRSTRDLFEVAIPRITIPADEIDGGYLLQLAAMAAEVNLSFEPTAHSTAWPEDRTFRNTTPQKLLNWYLRNTPGASAQFDREYATLNMNQPRPSWQESVAEWWNLHGPDW